jgi:hypothetical protein
MFSRRAFAALAAAALLSITVAASTLAVSWHAEEAQAAVVIKNGTGDPFVSLDEQELLKRIALACKNNAITSDAQWTTFVQTRFDATNASGLSAATRTFMIEFFTKLVKIE